MVSNAARSSANSHSGRPAVPACGQGAGDRHGAPGPGTLDIVQQVHGVAPQVLLVLKRLSSLMAAIADGIDTNRKNRPTNVIGSRYL